MIKIGLVGTGGMGSVHYANYQYLDDCKVVAVCGVSQADADSAAWLRCAMAAAAASVQLPGTMLASFADFEALLPMVEIVKL